MGRERHLKRTDGVIPRRRENKYGGDFFVVARGGGVILSRYDRVSLARL